MDWCGRCKILESNFKSNPNWNKNNSKNVHLTFNLTQRKTSRHVGWSRHKMFVDPPFVLTKVRYHLEGFSYSTFLNNLHPVSLYIKNGR